MAPTIFPINSKKTKKNKRNKKKVKGVLQGYTLKLHYYANLNNIGHV